METFTYDAFLGGKITLKQSKESYRATSDAIWLASCVPVQKGQSVLDVGIGTGAVSLALLEREPSLEITGVDKQPSLLLKAKENAVLNKRTLTLLEGDISAPLPALKGKLFHHVVTNPPFFKQTPARKGKNTALAHQEQLPLADWIGFCLKHIRAQGTFSIIHCTERLPEILSLLERRLGGICVLPLTDSLSKASKRCLVQGKLGSKAPFTLLPPLLTHTADGTPSLEAEKYLREGLFLNLKERG